MKFIPTPADVSILLDHVGTLCIGICFISCGILCICAALPHVLRGIAACLRRAMWIGSFLNAAFSTPQSDAVAPLAFSRWCPSTSVHHACIIGYHRISSRYLRGIHLDIICKSCCIDDIQAVHHDVLMISKQSIIEQHDIPRIYRKSIIVYHFPS